MRPTANLLLNFLVKLDTYLLQLLVTSYSFDLYVPFTGDPLAKLCLIVRGRLSLNSVRLHFLVVDDAFLKPRCEPHPPLHNEGHTLCGSSNSSCSMSIKSGKDRGTIVLEGFH